MKKFILLAFTLASFGNISAQAYLDDVMLQSFGWDEYGQSRIKSEDSFYNYYNSRAGVLKAHGFDMIWLPPPSVSTGGVGYFPTELYNFSKTSWGTEDQLKAMLANMNNQGLFPIADVVANHRSGTTGWTDFTNPAWGCDAITSNDEASTANYVGCKPSGSADTGDGFDGSRDMDHTNPTVQNGYIEYLSRLKALGFTGWRWDVAKGFAPGYFGKYIQSSTPYYSVGEYWDSNVDKVKEWITGTYSGGATISGAFDFPMYYTLSGVIQENASNNYASLNWAGATAGLAGQYGFAEKAVTFVDNHDTFVKSSAFSGQNIMMAYAYILTHPGIPCVFAPHYYGGTYSKDGITKNYGTGYADAINKLIAIRKTTGVNAWSHINIDKSEIGLYAAYVKKQYSDTEPVLAMKIGPYDWSPSGAGWILATSGTDYAVWTKTPVNVAPSINITPASNGSYTQGTTQTVTITATDDSGIAPTIRYTLDGTEPTATSPVYSAPISISNTTTVKAAAFDNLGLSSGTMAKNYVFTAASTPNNITVHFNPAGSGWSLPYIHYWGAQPTGTLADAQWGSPVAMTADPNNAGWYYYTFPNVTSINFLFRNGSSTGNVGVTQTGDITNVTQDTWYVWDPTNAKYVSTTASLATTDFSKNKTAFQVVQNPASNGELKIKYNNARGGVVSMFDMSGKLVRSFKLSSSSSEVETLKIGGIGNGIYLLQLKSEEGTATTKVIVK